MGLSGRRHTQDFTMEGVHVVGAGPGGPRDGSPPVEGQSPGRGYGKRSPPKAEAKSGISVQFLTFSCRKFGI